MKSYEEQNYNYSIDIEIDFRDGTGLHYDSIKGLNRGHALYLARQNWPGAEIHICLF